MEVRQAILEGRRLADAERYAQAMALWKEALGRAYSRQDFASMFVLATNVGEACWRLAEQEKDPQTMLTETTAHFDYALGVVDQCALRQVLGGYKALYRSVRRVEAMRGRVVKQMQQIQLERELQQEEGPCTTCAVNGEVVLDEQDGCYYCQNCYDAYYVGVGVDEKEQADVESIKELEGSADGESKAVMKHQGDTATEEETGEPGRERVRCERVELGSLADLLAGDPEPFSKQSATVADKKRYSVAELLDLRKISPSDCPAAVLTSPVYDDGSVAPFARGKNNSRKKAGKSTSLSKQADAASSAPEQPAGELLLPSLDLCDSIRRGFQEQDEEDTRDATLLDAILSSQEQDSLAASTLGL